MRDHVLATLSLALALGAAACGSSDEPSAVNPNAAPQAAANPAAPGGTLSPMVGNLRLVGVEIGRAVNPDKTMHDATSVFIPTDKVWTSVTIEGTAPKATLQARWVTDGGNVVEQSAQEMALTGRTVAAFNAGRPDGWAIGHYRVEVLLNGVAVGSRDFEIRNPPL